MVNPLLSAMCADMVRLSAYAVVFRYRERPQPKSMPELPWIS